MTTYKQSFYNVLVPVNELNEFLLFNTQSGGLEVLPEDVGNVLQNSTEYSKELFNDESNFFEYLVREGYLVTTGLDEIDQNHQSYLESQRKQFEVETSRLVLTIGTTINCNMGCPYCFEFVKPNKTLKSNEVISNIISYLESVISVSSVKHWEGLSVVWYGGEPLINKQLIKNLTPVLLDFCDRHQMSYSANIITNGLLLTDEAWSLLKEAKVTSLQVSLDGSKETHDKYRPLKVKQGKNYEKILENLARKPDGLDLSIRVGLDKLTFKGFERLLQDLSEYAIWPQNYKSVSIHTAWIRTYEEANEVNTSDRLSYSEYYDAQQQVRKTQLSYFNAWGKTQGLKSAKLRWLLPKIQTECGTWVSPYNIVIDPDGNIHKCWETIHDSSRRVKNVSDGFKMSDFDPYMKFDRYAVHEMCYSCKYLPVCDQLTCAVEAVKPGKPPCTYWKNNTERALKDQYLEMRAHPEAIAEPFNESKFNSGHVNK